MGCLCPPPGHLLDPGIEPPSRSLSHWQAGSLQLAPPGKTPCMLTTRKCRKEGLLLSKTRRAASTGCKEETRRRATTVRRETSRDAFTHIKQVCRSEEEPVRPWRDRWNQNENRGRGHQCPRTRPEWCGVAHRASCVPRAAAGVNISEC